RFGPQVVAPELPQYVAAPLRVHRSVQEVSLSGAATHRHELIDLMRRLNALGDDGDTQAAADPDDSADDRGIARVMFQVLHEAAIDLQAVDWHMLEIAEARISGAEIHLGTQGANGLNRRTMMCRAPDEGC